MTEQQNDWTPEPYEVHADTMIVSTSLKDKILVAQLAGGDLRIPGRTKAATARRIVACVNALRGIPTDSLEDGIIEKAMRAMIDLERIQRGEAQ